MNYQKARRMTVTELEIYECQSSMAQSQNITVVNGQEGMFSNFKLILNFEHGVCNFNKVALNYTSAGIETKMRLKLKKR